MRKIVLSEGEYYHIFNRSIAGFKIFNNNFEYLRFIKLLEYYQYDNRPMRFSFYSDLSLKAQTQILNNKNEMHKLVTLICYCIMPTHFHLLLKQNSKNGISRYIRLIEDSYSKYFNISHKRKGPLWESRFESVYIDTDEQLLHLTRYIHLNPTSAKLVDKPEKWNWSSYLEYLDCDNPNIICEYDDIITLTPKQYQEFVNDRKEYQQELSKVKHQLIDDYSG